MKLFSILAFFAAAGALVVHAEDDKYSEIGEYIYLGGNLYEKNEQLYFITEHPIMIGEGRLKYKPVYLKRFYFNDEDKDQLDPLLSDVIDRNSWRPISAFFYRDKNNLYCFTPSSDGGYLNYLKGVNPDSLKFIRGSEWKVPKMDGKRSSLYSDNLRKDFELISWYSSNGKDIFYRCRKLESADVNSFQLVDGESAWTAEDKRFFYDGGTQVKKN